MEKRKHKGLLLSPWSDFDPAVLGVVVHMRFFLFQDLLVPPSDFVFTSKQSGFRQTKQEAGLHLDRTVRPLLCL